MLNDLAPNDIGLVSFDSGRRGICCKVPSLIKNSKPKYQRLYDDSFHVYGARLWNSLPKVIKEKKSMDSFKISLSKLIAELPDNPPIAGVASENSLIHLLANSAAGRVITEVAGLESPFDEDVRRMS